MESMICIKAMLIQLFYRVYIIIQISICIITALFILWVNADLNTACAAKKHTRIFLFSVKKNAYTTQLSTHIAHKLKATPILTEVLSSFPQFHQGDAQTVP
jgi:hypothetical protein